MPRNPVQRLTIKSKGIQIDTSFVLHSSQGQGARYLASGEIDGRTALGLAIANLFAPLGLAIDGQDRHTIEAKIAECRRVSELYWQAALSMAPDGEVANQGPAAKKVEQPANGDNFYDDFEESF